MARRRKKFNIPIEQVRNIVVGIFLVFCFFVAGRTIYSFATKAPVFNVRSITLAPSLQFVTSGALDKLRGQNIFTVDLKKIERSVRSKYPQISDLKIERRFPDQVLVTAKKREAVAQAKIGGQFYTVDQDLVPMVASKYVRDDLPVLENINYNSNRMRMGTPLKLKSLNVGVQIIQAFYDHPYLSRYVLKSIDLENLSKIVVHIDQKFDVILDRDSIRQEVEKLGVLISQHKLNSDIVQYIDLRFKEPIVGKKQ